MNQPGETAPRSPLEKPLGELTEEDIAQLTREDCRKFLKDRGMRRPSWNKSQAIQQVISLKALLEGRPDSDEPPAVAADYKPPPPPPPPPPQQQSGDLAPSPYRRRDPPPPPPPPGAAAAREPPAEIVYPSPSSRSEPSASAADAPVGQMTIFYGGRVGVYDGVPVEKARAIMQLAAEDSSLFRSPPDPVGTSGRLFGGQRRDSGPHEWRASREIETEGPASRKASLQRYFEKRKDRFKGKRILGVPSPSNMEVTYLPQKFRGVHEPPSRSDTTSPTHPRPPGTPTRSSSIENKAPKLHFSVDLNEDGGGE